jgi:hypothetical protein
MNRRMPIVLAMAATIALSLATPAMASPTAEPAASGLTATQAVDVQKRVDEVLAAIPGGKQVSATEVKYDGLNVTIDPLYSPTSSRSVNAINCSEYYFCIIVRGNRFEFYACKKWSLTNWWGRAEFNNNQSGGTVARAYGQDATTEVFTHTAKGAGSIDVFSWWYFKPC